MGQRLRLKAGFDISRFPRQSRIVLRALKRYGMILADNGSSWYVSGAPEPRLGQRRPALARTTCRAARSRSWTPPVPRPGGSLCSPSASAARAGSTTTGAAALSGGPGQGPLARALLAGLRHRRGQLDLLQARLARRGRALGRADAAGFRVRRQGEPLHDAHQAPSEPCGGHRALLRGHRPARRVRQARARSSGSSRRTSIATTTGSAARSRCCRPGATASSSATRAGSRSRSTSSCARTTPRS